MRKTARIMLSFLIMITMIIGTMISVSAFTSEEENGVTGKHQVSGIAATGNFKITIKDVHDVTAIYKLAEMNWDAGNNTYGDVTWITEVQDWITSNPTYNTGTYQTPETLAHASSELQDEFFKALLVDAGNVVGSLAPVEAANISRTAPVAANVEAGTPGIPGYDTVTGQRFGIYGVLASNTELSKTYQPLTVALVPQQEGPVGHWYLSEEINATLKGSASISMVKTINGKTSETVQIGETVDFEVITGYPEYAVRETTGQTARDYTLSFDDTLSDAFSLDSSSVQLMYRTSSEGGWEALPETYNGKSLYTALIAGPAHTEGGVGVSVYACQTAAHKPDFQLYLFRYEGDANYYWYYYRDHTFRYLSTTTDNSATTLTSLRAQYGTATGDTVGHSVVYYPEWVTNVFNVTFNYSALKEYQQSLGSEARIVELRTTYQADVNSNAQVGTEYNSNTATLNYEESADGRTIGQISSTVHAYTYGVNIIKEDGTNRTNYLAGAVFGLYREMDTYCGHGAGTGDPLTDTTTATNYVWESNVDGVAGGAANLALVQADTSGARYYYYVEEVSSCTGHAEPHKHVRVFKKYGDSLTSNGTASGVTVKGLDPCNYIIQEETAPSGYNRLAEDILFSINELDSATAEATYSGSLAAFVDDGGRTITSGIYPLEVLNYKGVQLPSTGGMGTMIFTIIGIILMAVVTILLITRTKKRNRRNAMGLLAAALIVVTTVFSNSVDVSAVSTVKLDRQTGTVVTGEFQMTDFSVTTMKESDTISVYRIADMNWDGVENTYSDLQWVYPMTDWVNNNPTLSTFTSPELLGAGTVKEQTTFLNAITQDSSLMANLETGYKVNAAFIQKDGSTSFNITNQPFGLYLVLAENTSLGKTYQPVTVDAIPMQEGPFGHWYLQNNITATLKYESINVVKKINNEDFALVGTGDTVSFKVTAEVPVYPEPAGGVAIEYPFNIDDTISNAFSYQDGTLVVEYYDGTNWNTLNSNSYVALYGEAAPNAASNGIATYANGGEVIYVKSSVIGGINTLDYYSYNEDTAEVTHLFQQTGANATLALTPSISNTTLNANYNAAMNKSVTGTFSIQTVGNWKDRYNVSFVYDDLKALDAQQVRVSYQADATIQAVVGADSNVCPVDLYYQQDASGDIATISDVVNAWTYGMKVLKKDGDTNAYLSDAIFNLYREAYTYYAPAAVTETDEANYSSYLWHSNADESVTVPTGMIGGISTDLSTLDKVTEVEGGQFYYRVVSISAEDAASCTHADHAGAHNHIIVYKIESENITSVANAEGVTIKGLAPASYALREIQAPGGYNRMNEVLYFSINSLSEPQAALDGGSYKGFVGDDTTIYSDGIYPITVLNYSGMQLPSTGGAGTRLFIIIGCSVMAVAIILILVKRKKGKSQTYFL